MVFVWIIYESMFDAIELKKLLNLFAITLLSVTIESYVCREIGAYLVGYLSLLTLISCQILCVFLILFKKVLKTTPFASSGKVGYIVFIGFI